MIFENLLSLHLPPAASSPFAAAPFSAVMVNIGEITDHNLDEECLRRWLEAEELRRWSSFRLEKRQNEWLAGRICAKMALAALQTRDENRGMKAFCIGNRADGRPYVVTDHGEDERKVHISISHSNRRAAALASPHRCGIDVQHRSEKLHKVRERFCFEEELRLLQANRSGKEADLDLLNLLWTAKEAIRKAFSFRLVPGFLDLQLEHAGRHRQWYTLTFAHQASSFTTRGCRLGDYGLSLCFLPPEGSWRSAHA